MSAPLPPLESYIAMDCETVRARSGQVLARIGMTDYKGDVLLDSYVFVNPKNVVDYLSSVPLLKLVYDLSPPSSPPRLGLLMSNPSPPPQRSALTSVSGILPGHLVNAPTYETLRPTILSLLKGRILVGHAVYNDLKFVGHRHPYEDVRDTSLYYPLRQRLGIGREGEYPGLKKLYKEVFGEEIQIAAHDPVEDARATMRLFMSVREEYETALANSEDCVAGIPRSYELCYL